MKKTLPHLAPSPAPKRKRVKTTARGFGETPTKRFGVEIVARCELTGEETEIEVYTPVVPLPRGRSQCPAGYEPRHVAMEAAIQLTHLRIHDLYWKQGAHPAHHSIDARIWTNKTRSGSPVLLLSTAPFEGSIAAPLIEATNPNRPLTDEEVAQIKASEISFMVKKL